MTWIVHLRARARAELPRAECIFKEQEPDSKELAFFLMELEPRAGVVKAAIKTGFSKVNAYLYCCMNLYNSLI